MASNGNESLKDMIVYLTQQLKTKDEKIAELEKRLQATSVGLPNVTRMVFDRSGSNVTDSVAVGGNSGTAQKKWVAERLGEVNGAPDEQMRRTCMAKAVKENCKDIVAIIPYTNSPLPDVLRQTGCLGEEEDVRLTEQGMHRMNQIRRLITFLLDKDYRSMLVFVSFILEFDPSLGRRILDSNARFMDGCNESALKCTVCRLIDRVDITLVMDDLFSKELIDIDLYSVLSEQTEGRAGTWKTLIEYILTTRNHEQVADVVVDVLDKVEYHSDIVQMLRTDIQTNANSFDCECVLGKRMHLLKVPEFEERLSDSGYNGQEINLLDTDSLC